MGAKHPKNKITSSLKEKDFQLLAKAHVNGEISNDVYSIMTPALRKKLNRYAKHNPHKKESAVEEVNNAS